MNNKNSNKKRVKFLASIAFPFALAVASLQGCGKIEDKIAITPDEKAYAEFGVSEETLKETKNIEKISELGEEKIGNDVYMELFPSHDFEGNIEEGNEGILFKTRYQELLEKIANAINRKLRNDNDIIVGNEGEENAEKYIEAKDISIEEHVDKNGKKYFKINVTGERLFSSEDGSKNPISKEVLDDIEECFKIKSINIRFGDINRKKMYKELDKYLDGIEEGLKYELVYTKDGALKIGKQVDRYPLGDRRKEVEPEEEKE